MTLRKFNRFALAMIGIWVLGSSLMTIGAHGQSFNIDIDSSASPPALGGGVPSPTFGGAANQPGVWNSYPSTSSAVPLANLNGSATGVSVQVTATSTSVTVLGFNNPNNTGDFALLFNDGSQIGTTVQGGNRTYSFSGLQNGPYSVLTYTARPQGIEGELQVDVTGSNEGPLIAFGTPMGNTFTSGVTHVVHTVNVMSNTIDIRLVDFPGAPAGYVSGFQLTLIPEPTHGLISLGLGLLCLRNRRK